MRKIRNQGLRCQNQGHVLHVKILDFYVGTLPAEPKAFYIMSS